MKLSKIVVCLTLVMAISAIRLRNLNEMNRANPFSSVAAPEQPVVSEEDGILQADADETSWGDSDIEEEGEVEVEEETADPEVEWIEELTVDEEVVEEE